MDQILDAQTYQDNRPREYAGFWIRVAAAIIDGIILSIAFWVLIFIFGFIAADTVSDADVEPNTIIAGVIGFYALIIGGFLLYHALMESSERQATLGKIAVGIKVGDAKGNKLSFANALGRTAAKYISQLILCIGYMMVGWDDRKQGLHDKIADTYVFYK
jgi:uncharacterized RDD family membrane protein YckC